MSVTPEFVKKELLKLEKKVQANETTRKEALDALDKAETIKLNLQREEVALRTLAAGGIPKAARPALAQQLAEVMKVNYDEASIMELITKYEKQDTVAEPSKPSAPKPSSPKADVTPAAGDAPADAPKKQRGRPKMTEEEKAAKARERALAAAAAALPPAVEEADSDDEDEDEFFDPDAYDVD
jgi:hypothetical protein